MICPFCTTDNTKVIDKRDLDQFTRRRRECLDCGKRFSTRELVERSDFKVVKKNGGRESFDRAKVKLGIIKACEKRPVGEDIIENMVNTIENKARKKGNEVPTNYIGELVSRELKKADKVAYIRFASVYRDFTDVSDFKKEIRELLR